MGASVGKGLGVRVLEALALHFTLVPCHKVALGSKDSFLMFQMGSHGMQISLNCTVHNMIGFATDLGP